MFVKAKKVSRHQEQVWKKNFPLVLSAQIYGPAKPKIPIFRKSPGYFFREIYWADWWNIIIWPDTVRYPQTSIFKGCFNQLDDVHHIFTLTHIFDFTISIPLKKTWGVSFQLWRRQGQNEGLCNVYRLAIGVLWSQTHVPQTQICCFFWSYSARCEAIQYNFFLILLWGIPTSSRNTPFLYEYMYIFSCSTHWYCSPMWKSLDFGSVYC